MKTSSRLPNVFAKLVPPSLLFLCGSLAAQVPNPMQTQPNTVVEATPRPVIRITVVSKTVTAVNYRHRTETTKISLRGTELMPSARGSAAVESKMGSTKIETKVDRLVPPGTFGPEFLTYVLWAITPEGRAQNLGELAPDHDNSKLLSTTELQAFGLIVTAEPYFAVTQPSDAVVMENFLRDTTVGRSEQVQAKYELLHRGAYTLQQTDYHPMWIDPKGPLQLTEARNAVQIAAAAGAPHYAPDSFQKARADLQRAEQIAYGSGSWKDVETLSREATQTAEDARIIAIRKSEQEEHAAQLARERAIAVDATALAAANAKAHAQTQAAQQTARATAVQQVQPSDKVSLRTQLVQQLNPILETRDTARGLVVTVSDALFDPGQYTIRADARNKLARICSILVAHPGLKVDIEGLAYSSNGVQYNQGLAQQRATAVRDYFITQGLPVTVGAEQGFANSAPAPGNVTAGLGRVEIVVSGVPIGEESRLR